jgi:hypothetical protein
MTNKSGAEQSFEQWLELRKALDTLLDDALYVAGYRLSLSHYAEIPEGESVLSISKAAFKENVRALSELLDDLEVEISDVREKLQAYISANE